VLQSYGNEVAPMGLNGKNCLVLKVLSSLNQKKDLMQTGYSVNSFLAELTTYKTEN